MMIQLEPDKHPLLWEASKTVVGKIIDHGFQVLVVLFTGYMTQRRTGRKKPTAKKRRRR